MDLHKAIDLVAEISQRMIYMSSSLKNKQQSDDGKNKIFGQQAK